MEIRQLKSFRVVAERLNFTRAADDLHLAQSSVSAQIKALEDDLGIRLFDRIGKRIVLTEAGDKLLSYARRMEQMTDEIRGELSGSGDFSGSITIRMPETIASEYMPEVVELFQDEYPNVRLMFINCDDARLREELNTGRIDMAFLMTDSVNFKNVTVTTLRSEGLVLTAAPTHPLTLKRKVLSSDLQGQTVLHLRVD